LKRLFPIILVLCSLALTSYGQKKRVQYNPSYDKRPFHLGFALGFNSLDYRITPAKYLLYSYEDDTVYRVEPISTIGINLAIISDLRMGEHMNLRFQPGLIFGQRNLLYTERDWNKPDELAFKEYEMRLSTIYLDAPVNIKFRAKRINNYRPYVLAGMAVKYDLETKRVARENDGPAIQQIPLDYFYEFGFGIDFYLVYFKLGTELKLSYGLKNILVNEPYQHSSVIEKLRSRMVILALHFE